jgi:hypothetical protein
MLSVEVVLRFHCCACDHPVQVTVCCSGKGLAAGLHTVAAVRLPCPSCGATNQLYFEPSGRLRAVEPGPSFQPAWTPSWN